MPDEKGYENPSYKGDGGDRAKPKSAGGKKGGDYDNAPNSTFPSEKESRFGGGGTKKGYDNAKTDQDLGFSGHGKDSLGKRR
jgi:hypothetical protein